MFADLLRGWPVAGSTVNARETADTLTVPRREVFEASVATIACVMSCRLRSAAIRASVSGAT